MKKTTDLVRRVELCAIVRKPAPPSYDLTPKNRKQRRVLAKALRRADRQAQKKG